LRIYFDVCSLNRLTDDQNQPRIREEAEAVESIFRLIRESRVEWVSSAALHAEVERNPNRDRRREAQVLLSLAARTIFPDPAIVERARAFELAGYGAFDALHLSFAEAGAVEVLLTTDDRFVSRATRGVAAPRLRVLNPVIWLRELIV
jgi:PIN domain.